MRKTKFFKRTMAVALSAMLALGGTDVPSASAASGEYTVITEDFTGSDVVEGGWWQGFSNYYKRMGDFDVIMDITVDTKANNYAPCIIITTDADRAADGYVEYLLMRTDNWAWGSLFNGGEAGFVQDNNNVKENGWWFADPANGCVGVGDADANLYDRLPGANVQYRITRTGNSIKVLQKVTPKDSSDSYDQWTIVASDDMSQSIRMFVASDTNTLTVNSVKDVVKVQKITVTAESDTVENEYIYASEADKTAGNIATDNCGSVQLSAAVAPENALEKGITWSISNEEIAQISDDGLLTLNKKAKDGDTITVTATATDGGGAIGTCKITVSVKESVESTKVESLSIGDQTVLMGWGISEGKIVQQGQSVTPKIEFTPANPDITDVTFTSDSDVIKIEGNKITALKMGTATITATSKSSTGANTTFDVTVSDSKLGELTAEGITVEAFASAQSGFEKLSGDFNIVYTFNNKTTGSAKEHNFVFEVTDGNDKWQTLRADAYGWGIVAAEAIKWTGALDDWTDFNADMKDADVIVNAIREGSKLTVKYHITGKSTANKYNIAAVAENEALSNDLYAHLIGEKVQLSNIKLIDNKTVFNLPTEIASEAVVDTDFKNVRIGDSIKFKVTPPVGYSVTVTYDDDKLTADADGNYTIPFVVDNTAKLIVTAKTAVAISSIALDKDAAELKVGESLQLLATVSPEGTDESDIKWTSSDSSVATVDASGKVTAVAEGTATITVASVSDSNINDTCTITVKNATTGGNTSGGSTSGGNTSGGNTSSGSTTTTPVASQAPAASEAPVASQAPTASEAPVASQTPAASEAPAASQAPEASQTPEASETPQASQTPAATKTPANDNTPSDEPEKQTNVTAEKQNGVTVKVDTKANGTATISTVKKTDKTTITVSSTITVNDVEYKVTVIDSYAFKKCTEVTTINLPSTVVTIKKNAFSGTKKLKTVKINSKKAVTVKKGAFKGLSTKKMTVKVTKKMPKKQFTKMKKNLKKAGFKGKIKRA